MAEAKNTGAKGRLKELDKEAKAKQTVVTLKPLEFVPGALEALVDLGPEAKKLAGMELTLVQAGETPTDYDTMTEIGPGTFEIRLQTGGQWVRVFYVARFADAIYVLDAVQKAQNALPKVDKDRVRQRYKLAEKLSAAAVTAAKKANAAAKTAATTATKAKTATGKKGK